MGELKYTAIKTPEQYNKYCNILEWLVQKDDDKNQEEIELLIILIEKWDDEHNTFEESKPVELLKSLMKENNLKAKDLADILDLSKGTISKILNYHKGLSKTTIQKLSEYFKISQEAFNRPYHLINNVNSQHRYTLLNNTKKSMLKI
jgi:HTH-type transcriptional regulator/antitoxin HigA